jgi:hypothetical protein
MGQSRERKSERAREREVFFQRLLDFIGPLKELTIYFRLSDLKLTSASCGHGISMPLPITTLFNIFPSVFKRVNVFGNRKLSTKYGQCPSQQETTLEYVDRFLMIRVHHVFIAAANQLAL